MESALRSYIYQKLRNLSKPYLLVIISDSNDLISIPSIPSLMDAIIRGP
jgi:hypothetical protein